MRDHRHRRDQRADRPGARRQRRRHVFVANRRRDRAISLARRYGGAIVGFDELPEALEQADIVVAATASPHLMLEPRGAASVMGQRGRPAAAADRPRGPARHRRRLRRARRGVAVRHRRPPGGGRPQPQGRAPRRRARPRGSSRRRSSSFARWLGPLEVLPTRGRAARARRIGSSSRWWPRTPGKWETASPRDLERVDAMARARRQPAAARADVPAEGARATTASTRGWRWCASCSASTSRRR